MSGNTNYGSGTTDVNGTNNTSFGVAALHNTDTSSSNNTSVGAYSLTGNNTGISNVSVGSNSLLSNTSGNYNTGLGTASLVFNTTGNSNTAVGSNSLEYNTTGNSNIGVGIQTLYNNKIGNHNTAVGTYSQYGNTGGSFNVSFGSDSLYNNNANNNSAIGYGAMYNNTTGTENISFGTDSLNSNTNGSYNSALGVNAGSNNTGGIYNTFVGHNANGSTGSYSTAIGYNSVFTGDNQIVLGTNDEVVVVPGIIQLGNTSGNFVGVTGSVYYNPDYTSIFYSNGYQWIKGSIGITALSSIGLADGVTLTNDAYLQMAYAMGGATYSTPGLMPESYSDIFSTTGIDFGSNFGTNWIENTSIPSELNWSSLSLSTSGQYQSACVFNYTIYISSDYGKSWLNITTDTDGGSLNNPWKSISISSSGKYQTALGNGSYIYISSDYGVNWTPVKIDATGEDLNKNWYSVSISASGQYQTAIVQGGPFNTGLIYKSSDFGNTWNKVSDAPSGYLHSVSISASGQYQSAVQSSSGSIYTSSNFGNTWNQINNGYTNNAWYSISISASGQYQTTAINGSNIFVSDDYGNTWEDITTDSTGNSLNRYWRSVSISESGQYQIAVSTNGSIAGYVYTSSNYGKTWTLNNFLSSNYWNAVSLSKNGQYITLVENSTGRMFTCQNSIANGIVQLGGYNSSSISLTGCTGGMFYDTSGGPGSYNFYLSDGNNWTSKSFIIDHPEDENKYLVHACLEGPENGVFYRGTAKITNGEFVLVQLPSYVQKLAVDFTVHVTPIYNGKINTCNASRVQKNQFTVYGPNCEFDWIVHASRGPVFVEPKKSDVTVKGDGPYKYIL